MCVLLLASLSCRCDYFIVLHAPCFVLCFIISYNRPVRLCLIMLSSIAAVSEAAGLVCYLSDGDCSQGQLGLCVGSSEMVWLGVLTPSRCCGCGIACSAIGGAAPCCACADSAVLVQ